MELVSEKLHLVLTYVAAIERAGASLSEEQLEAFARNPRPATGWRRWGLIVDGAGVGRRLSAAARLHCALSRFRGRRRPRVAG